MRWLTASHSWKSLSRVASYQSQSRLSAERHVCIMYTETEKFCHFFLTSNPIRLIARKWAVRVVLSNWVVISCVATMCARLHSVFNNGMFSEKVYSFAARWMLHNLRCWKSLDPKPTTPCAAIFILDYQLLECTIPEYTGLALHATKKNRSLLLSLYQNI